MQRGRMGMVTNTMGTVGDGDNWKLRGWGRLGVPISISISDPLNSRFLNFCSSVFFHCNSKISYTARIAVNFYANTVGKIICIALSVNSLYQCTCILLRCWTCSVVVVIMTVLFENLSIDDVNQFLIDTAVGLH